MKVYTNGCSFTHGEDNFIEEPEFPGYPMLFEQTYKGYEFKTCVDKTVWPWLLKDNHNIDFVFNHALRATGHTRLHRSTLEFISHLREQNEDLDDWIFLLQFSQPHRKEYQDPNKEDWWIQLYPAGSPEEYAGDNWREAITPFVRNRDLPGLEETEHLEWEHYRDTAEFQHTLKPLFDYKFLYESNRVQEYDITKEMLNLVSTLEMLGVKYLITGIDAFLPRWYSFGQYNHHTPMTPQRKVIYDLIPKHNVIDDIAHILDPEFKDDQEMYSESSHPIPEGNRLFANYIIEEMEKRNWLT